MNNSRKPNVKLYLSKDKFNSLVSALTLFIESKREIGETVFSEQSEQLRAKIFKHGYASQTKNGERAAVHFFEREAAILIKLLIYHINLSAEPCADFYSELKNRKSDSEKKPV